MADGTVFCSNCKRQVFAANYDLHFAHCEKRITLCQRCDEPVLSKEMDEHVREMHSRIFCNKCGLGVECWQLDDHHEKTCMKRLECCRFCELPCHFDELGEHENMCGARTEKCPNCRELVLIKSTVNHMEQCCIKRLLSCDVCKLELPYDEFAEHYYQCVALKKLDLAEEEESVSYESLTETNQFHKSDFPSFRFQDRNDQSFAGSDRHSGQLEEQDNSDDSEKIMSHGQNPHQLEKSRSEEQGICPICGVTYLADDLCNHIRQCDAHIFICSYCGENIPVKETTNHSKICSKMLSICNMVGRRSPETQRTDEMPESSPVEMENSHEYIDSAVANCHLLASQRSGDTENYSDPLCLNQDVRNPEMSVQQIKKQMLPCKDEGSLGISERECGAGASGSVRNECSDGVMPPDGQMNEKKICDFCTKRIPCDAFDEHLAQCGSSVYLCPLCNSTMSCFDMKDHFEQCYTKHAAKQDFPGGAQGFALETKENESNEKKMGKLDQKSCSMCNELVPLSTYKSHSNHCGNRVIQCNICGTSLKLKERSTHFNQCEKPCDTSNHQKKGKKKGRGLKKVLLGEDIENGSEDFSVQNSSVHSRDPGGVYIPCEFCQSSILADNLIEHESGCRPDLFTGIEGTENEYSSAGTDPTRHGTDYFNDVSHTRRNISHCRESEGSMGLHDDVDMEEMTEAFQKIHVTSNSDSVKNQECSSGNEKYGFKFIAKANPREYLRPDNHSRGYEIKTEQQRTENSQRNHNDGNYEAHVPQKNVICKNKSQHVGPSCSSVPTERKGYDLPFQSGQRQVNSNKEYYHGKDHCSESEKSHFQGHTRRPFSSIARNSEHSHSTDASSVVRHIDILPCKECECSHCNHQRELVCNSERSQPVFNNLRDKVSNIQREPKYDNQKGPSCCQFSVSQSQDFVSDEVGCKYSEPVYYNHGEIPNRSSGQNKKENSMSWHSDNLQNETQSHFSGRYTSSGIQTGTGDYNKCQGGQSYATACQKSFYSKDSPRNNNGVPFKCAQSRSPCEKACLASSDNKNKSQEFQARVECHNRKSEQQTTRNTRGNNRAFNVSNSRLCRRK